MRIYDILHTRRPTNSIQTEPHERYDGNVSADWRSEYRALGVDPDAHEVELVTDGGRERDRPTDCICWGDSNDLPCFPCVRSGFSTSSDDPPEDDTDVDNYPASIGDTTGEEVAAIATDGGSRFTLPEEGTVVYNKKYGGPVAETLVLQIRPNSAAKDVIILEDDDATVADLYPKYSPDAPVAQVAKVRNIERTLGEEWSVAGVRRAVADGDIPADTVPTTMLSETLGEKGSPFFEEVRQYTEDIDGIGPATTELFTREFDDLADMERAVEVFPYNERRFKRCRRGSNPDALFEMLYAIQDVVAGAPQTTLADAGGVDQ
jgi:hypothetical protein